MRCSNLALSVGLAFFSNPGYAQTYTFDPAMLDGGKGNVNMALLDQGVPLPGTYQVDILLNGKYVDSRDVVFTLAKNTQGQPFLQPCLSVDSLSRYGVRVEDYPNLSSSGQCAQLSAIAQATSDFQFNNQQLLLNIPQVSLRPKVTGIAPQQLWDDGIPALLLNYSANASRTELRNGNGVANSSTDSTYVQLNPGANLGSWHLRNQTNWQQQGEHSGRWQTVYTYVEKGLYALKSRVYMGDRTTPGDIFDGVPFRGVMIGTDENMVPYNQRAFAPIVRGIARTQARVEVRQNGYVVYSATVAPGPFALTDLSAAGGGGDLQVTVWETDGQPQVFTVPYQTPAIAVREGYLKYNLMTGLYRPADASIDKTPMGQMTVMYGLPWSLTVYGGLQSAEHYQASSLGLGKSLGNWGALSLDGALSHGQRNGQDEESGAAWRVRYSKNIVATNTTLTMTNYQYASSGYNSLSDVLDTWHGGLSDTSLDRRKSSTSLSLSQSFGEWGNLNVSSSRNNYWNRSVHDNTFGISYGVGIKGISLSLGWTQSKQARMDRTSYLSVSVPLDRWLTGARATYLMTSPSEGGSTQEAGISGQSFERQLYWDMRQRYRPGSMDSHSSAVNLTWNGTYGQVGGNYSYSPQMHQMGASVSGGMIAHRHGITLGQSLGDTVALVEAPGVSGVSVGGWPGVKTDYRGYTPLSYLIPYQDNLVSLDPINLPSNSEVRQTDLHVVPTQGAVVPVRFATRIGARALMTLTRKDGYAIPFGAVVTLIGQGVGAGVVGDNGQVYLTGLPEQGRLKVVWAQQQCWADYRLPKNAGAAGVYIMAGVCR